MIDRRWLAALAAAAVLLSACATTTPAGEPARAAGSDAASGNPQAQAAPKVDEEGLPSPPATLLAATDEPPAGASIGDLLVAPTRLLFEDGETTAEVSLINVGERRATYRISLIDYEMTESGSLTPTDSESNQASARRLLRYSPRQVTLDARMVQTIRVQVRRPGDLPPGEYRSHLLFQSVPPPIERSAETPQEETEGVRIELRPIFGISIPVIIRNRTNEAPRAELQDVRLVRDGDAPAVELRIRREGETSSYGRLQVYWVPRGGEARVIGLLSGIAVYPPLNSRTVRVPLQTTEVPTGGGTIRVTYSDEEGAEGRVLAETSVEVP